ncbi:MAG TPA: flavodoxin [Candidatus Ratteibacteria bacterium]|uniref:Flavodoxin n=1 Tax=candidate division TA06 bacterium ADurb.Bin131 TaxID=1852827 RepID=A0A1V6CAB0_UNCT6|nr:MAG: flavodoxin [candidate division TA06 bacterium ADurb.Bin131]HOC03286.1 flavodoxin [bacterium]HRS06684.1 flavodoxin [Candidatus Ratteibacteria bacterium]HON05640.1 flavodoxin [bacterium]HQL64742.1 flavodoxin [bacterium]
MNKKVLVIFYSRTGITKKVAEKIADILSCDIEEITDLKNRRGIKGFIVGIKDSIRKNTTKIKPVEKNPSDYSMVIIGTPVWALSMAPAIRTYIYHNKSKFNDVAFFCTAGGTGIEKTIIEMGTICNKKPVATFAGITSNIKKNMFKGLDEFIIKIKESIKG